MGQKDSGCSLVIDNFIHQSDYQTYCELWNDYGVNAPDIDVLSRYGFKVTQDNKMICAGFLYDTGCSMCMFEWFIVNKNAKKEVRGEALNKLLEKITYCAKMANYKYIYTATDSEAFAARLRNYNFNCSTEKKQLHMFCRL